jgi:hypothetical protein
MAAGADGSNLKVNCSMVQAFEIPSGTGQRPGDDLLPEPP